MQEEVEVFAIGASNNNCKLLNRWVIYNVSDAYEVYLETTKQNKVSKVHASSFANQEEAIDFITKMDHLCTNGKPFNINAYMETCKYCDT